jgi:hypothetical protein
LILWRIGRRGGMGLIEFHSSISNKTGLAKQGLFSAYAAWVGGSGGAAVRLGRPQSRAVAVWIARLVGLRARTNHSAGADRRCTQKTQIFSAPFIGHGHALDFRASC